MNYWSVFCMILKYLPGSYLVLNMIEPISKFIRIGKIILPFSYDLIIILIVLQILSILFVKSVENSEQVISELTLKGYKYITWGEVKKIDTIKYLSPVTYLVVRKKGLPFPPPCILNVEKLHHSKKNCKNAGFSWPHHKYYQNNA